MGSGVDLSMLYKLRKDFTIIALTGRTGSGATTISNQISKGFLDEYYINPEEFELSNNSYRKYRIVHRFAKENFTPYLLINYRDILTIFLLTKSLDDFTKFLESNQVSTTLKVLDKEDLFDFKAEIGELKKISEDFENYQEIFNNISFDNFDDDQSMILYNSFFSSEFKSFSNRIHSSLSKVLFYKHNIILQLVSNNIRRSGNPFIKEDLNPSNIFNIAELINKIIKSVRVKKKKDPVKIVIDSLRNPFEVMFFRERYCSFYLMAVNRDDKQREESLKKKYNREYDNIKVLLEGEYKGGKGKQFYKQYVQSCIEKADIHITYRSEEETKSLNKNKNKNDKTSPYYTWQMQLLKYIALIEQPGIITPSPEERCMQLAYTAKYNSGCISRQVGATITDNDYSVKAIGWNNTPAGHVPCLLRNAEDLIAFDLIPDNLNEEERKKMEDKVKAFTPYERKNEKFRKAFSENYENQIKDNKDYLNGRNISICFKSLQNSCAEGKNQVHTRALHAEESAFLQITKYGGNSVEGGKLFTTSSPCELCAKKAYQLGIKVIYYIDPYPGISLEQILQTGSSPPEVRLFNGAIGNAYHLLYEPLMPYKNELSFLLGQDIKDLTSQHETKIKDLENQNKELKEEIEILKKNGSIK